MTSREIRSSFLAYFEKHGHRVVPSSPLVPADDPTLLFTNAGMNQFKDVFLGRETREYRRAASAQKCMRVSGKHNDLDNVGPSPRHHTFFEMLGNFSFGDYFKDEAVELAWHLLTEAWRLDPARLHATVFRGGEGVPRDEEAYRAWRRFLPAERVGTLGMEDNFWSMGDTGPCGRCSEIYYDCEPAAGGTEDFIADVEAGAGRFVEIWNNVFMEFDRQADGTLAPLPAPSIDTGMGLERVTAVLQGAASNYDTDLFQPVLEAVADLAGIAYATRPATDVSMRVVADHLRAATFLIADGVMPSNEWRGYVLRKIMRRAMRHGKRLGLREPFLHDLVGVLVEQMGGPYPELAAGRDAIVRVVRSEEERFDAVLNAGLPRLEEAIERAAAGSGIVAGDEAFRLYDSIGLPLDFIEDLAAERRLRVDRGGFERAMDEQRARARAGSAFETKQAQAFSFASERARLDLGALGDAFEGYVGTSVTGEPLAALFDAERRQVTELPEGARGYVVLARTPFYVESGGQVSDVGLIRSDASGATAEVVGMTRLLPGGPRAHEVRVTVGTLRERDLVTAQVDAAVRDAVRRSHTATHLLHAALRQVLGGHARQAGSLVAPDRLRFDFIHVAAVTGGQIRAIEQLVAGQVLRNTPLVTEITTAGEAMAAGAMALFGEKYGDRVRVVSVPGFSLELCGGTHVRATGDIGPFTIVEETGVAAGVRRIEALTGLGALLHHQEQRETLEGILHALGTTRNHAAAAIERLQTDARRLSREMTELKTRLAVGSGGNAAADGDAVEIAGIRMLARHVPGLEKDALRAAADSLKARLGSGLVVLASESSGKVAIVVSVTKDLAGRIHAGRIVKAIAPIVGGGGGGRADFAEAGGREADKIPELLVRSREIVEEQLAGKA